MEMTREQMLGTITVYQGIQVWRDKEEGQGE